MEDRRPVYCFSSLVVDTCLALICATISWLLSGRNFEVFKAEFVAAVVFFISLSVCWNLYKRWKGG